ncbi:hypothetical protein [Dubosiella newyorkensis]|uniref:hypothetical protein n=1 Tax=Dubosiella newyorkensis TaxID=1862672 RepID=UPI0023F1DD3B|nr:hypothetical protein [Dubosiella newyorkensis]
MKITNNEKKIIAIERANKLKKSLKGLVEDLKAEEEPYIFFRPAPRARRLILDMKSDYESLFEVLDELDGERE